jgi:hypothetical protein
MNAITALPITRHEALENVLIAAMKNQSQNLITQNTNDKGEVKNEFSRIPTERH